MKVRKHSNQRTLLCLSAVVLVVAFSTPRCLADLGDPVDIPGDLIGSLAADGGGLVATGAWDSSSTIVEWEVTDNATYWTYEYTFTVPEKALSHFILQVSDTFDDDDIWNVDPGALVIELDEFGDAPSNPGIPGTLGNAVKFENYDEDTTWVWSFDTLRDPVWQNFYAVDGKSTAHGALIPYAFNTGFDGSGTDFIVGPDTTVIPVPPAVLLGMIGLSVVGIKLRKRT